MTTKLLTTAISKDNVEQYVEALSDCNERCLSSYYQDEHLFDAADYGALKIAAHLLPPQGVMHVTPLQSHRTGLPAKTTCEGSTLDLSDALSMAVTRNNAAMVNLMLPFADEGTRRAALRKAAELDRFDIVQHLFAAGVPIMRQGEVREENNTLLVSAAEGAALRVGHWLIDEQNFPVNALKNGPDHYSGEAPLQALLRFRSAVGDVNRVKPFLEMLASHGADIDALGGNGTTALSMAIKLEDRGEAALLLAVGAQKSQLDANQLAALEKLLATPPSEKHEDKEIPGCIKPGE